MTSPDVADVCDRFVSWWDGEYEGNCVRPRDHDGDHWDGLSWYDDEGNLCDQAHNDRPADAIRGFLS